jgi:hypothetical protein
MKWALFPRTQVIDLFQISINQPHGSPHGSGQAFIVCYHNKCQSFFLLQVGKYGMHTITGLHVKISGWLISQKQGGRHYQGTGYCHTLLLAARQLTGTVGHSVR